MIKARHIDSKKPCGAHYLHTSVIMVHALPMTTLKVSTLYLKLISLFLKPRKNLNYVINRLTSQNRKFQNILCFLFLYDAIFIGPNFIMYKDSSFQQFVMHYLISYISIGKGSKSKCRVLSYTSSEPSQNYAKFSFKLT